MPLHTGFSNFDVFNFVAFWAIYMANIFTIYGFSHYIWFLSLIYIHSHWLTMVQLILSFITQKKYSSESFFSQYINYIVSVLSIYCSKGTYTEAHYTHIDWPWFNWYTLLSSYHSNEIYFWVFFLNNFTTLLVYCPYIVQKAYTITMTGHAGPKGQLLHLILYFIFYFQLHYIS